MEGKIRFLIYMKNAHVFVMKVIPRLNSSILNFIKRKLKNKNKGMPCNIKVFTPGGYEYESFVRGNS
jgi:hypothetical protein